MSYRWFVIVSFLLLLPFSALLAGATDPGSSALTPDRPVNVQTHAGPGLLGEVTVTWDAPDPGASPILRFHVWRAYDTTETLLANLPADARGHTFSIDLFSELLLPGEQTVGVSASNAYGMGPTAYMCFVWSPYGTLQGVVLCE